MNHLLKPPTDLLTHSLTHLPFAMLPTALLQEIERLLREAKLSQRQIAERLNVSRGTICAVASGRHRRRGREHFVSNSPLVPTAPPVRCPHCGYRVYLPCNICRTRAHRQRQRLIALLARTTTYQRPKQIA